eukprot:70237_1
MLLDDLPVELHAIIMAALTLSDVCRVRSFSHYWYQLGSRCQEERVRYTGNHAGVGTLIREGGLPALKELRFRNNMSRQGYAIRFLAHLSGSVTGEIRAVTPDTRTYGQLSQTMAQLTTLELLSHESVLHFDDHGFLSTLIQLCPKLRCLKLGVFPCNSSLYSAISALNHLEILELNTFLSPDNCADLGSRDMPALRDFKVRICFVYPFPNVRRVADLAVRLTGLKSLSISGPPQDDWLVPHNRIMPNVTEIPYSRLQHLDFTLNRVIVNRLIEHQFPQLQSVFLYLNSDIQRNDSETNQRLATCFHTVKSMHVTGEARSLQWILDDSLWDPNFLAYPNLVEFQLKMDDFISPESDIVKSLANITQRMRSLALIMPNFPLPEEVIPYIITSARPDAFTNLERLHIYSNIPENVVSKLATYSFPNLQDMKINCDGGELYTQAWCNFARKLKSVKTLEVSDNVTEWANFLKDPYVFPNLETVYNNAYENADVCINVSRNIEICPNRMPTFLKKCTI